MRAAGSDIRKNLVTALLLALTAIGGCEKPKLVPHTESRPLMGATVAITTEGQDRKRLQHATNAAYREMARLWDILDQDRPESAVGAINRDAGKRPVAAPPELMYVLRMAQNTSKRTQGAFDVTAGAPADRRLDHRRPAPPAVGSALSPPADYRGLILDENAGTAFLAKPGMRLDLRAVTRLYALHAGMGMLKRNGVAHARIDAGDAVEVVGGFAGQPWRVDVRDARAPGKIYGTVELKHGFVVSVDDQRGRRVLAPKSGRPAPGPRGVTVIAEDLELTIGLAEAIMVMGDADGRAFIEQRPTLEGIIFAHDDSVWVSPGLGPRLRFTRADGKTR